jgi:hypothetical protein
MTKPRKKPLQKSPGPEVLAAEAKAVEQAVLLLVGGVSRRLVEQQVAGSGVAAARVAEVVQAAREKIRVAADYDRSEEVGLAVTRCEDIYRKALAAKDLKTALAANKEKSRLRRLYERTEGETGSEGAAGGGAELEECRRVLAAIAGHVLPLELAEAGYPLEEHVRIAASRLSRPA